MGVLKKIVIETLKLEKVQETLWDTKSEYIQRYII
jgi:hypothetical protein